MSVLQKGKTRLWGGSDDRFGDGLVGIIGTDADGHNDLMSRITAFLATHD